MRERCEASGAPSDPFGFGVPVDVPLGDQLREVCAKQFLPEDIRVGLVRRRRNECRDVGPGTLSPVREREEDAPTIRVRQGLERPVEDTGVGEL